MSQKVTAKRRKLKRIKRHKREADRSFEYRQTPEYQAEAKASLKKLARKIVGDIESRTSICPICNEEILDGKCEDCTKALCSPLTGWTENQ